MKIITIFNQKGGVGKTTTAVNLTAGLNLLQYKCLCVDFDPQGNATSAVGINKKELEHTAYSLVMGKSSVEDTIVKTDYFDIIPSNSKLSMFQFHSFPNVYKEKMLYNVLKTIDSYDFCIIDCPPSFGLLSVNALIAADSLLVPIQCEYYALEGMADLLDTYGYITRYFNPTLLMEGVLLTMYDSRTTLSKNVAEDVKAHFKMQLYNSKIPRSVKVAEAPSVGIPLLYREIATNASLAYMDFVKEFLSRNSFEIKNKKSEVRSNSSTKTSSTSSKSSSRKTNK